MKKNNKKGFTLAELLIVVAIIAVLVAVAIPVFNAQLERSRDATSVANLRSAYAQAQIALIQDDDSDMDNVTMSITDGAGTIVVTGVTILSKDSSNDWANQAEDLPFTVTDAGEAKNATVTFNVADGVIESASYAAAAGAGG